MGDLASSEQAGVSVKLNSASAEAIVTKYGFQTQGIEMDKLVTKAIELFHKSKIGEPECK
jgi:hypothetical protein